MSIFARMGLTPSASAPSSVAIRSRRLAPKTTPVLPYSFVPQHHGMSCVPKSEYAPGPSASAATQLKPPYAQMEPTKTFLVRLRLRVRVRVS